MLDFNKLDFKKLGILAVFGYLLSLPILIWKSSKIGKVIYIVLFLVFGVKAIVYSADKLSNAYFNIQGIFETRKQINPILKEIEEIKQELIDQRKALRGFKESMDTERLEVIKSAETKASKEMQSILDSLSEVKEYSKILKDQEREAAKKAVTEMIEQVKIKKRSIDEAEIRDRLEKIIEVRKLFTDEEEKRFFKYLEEIGFKIKQTENNSRRIYANTYSVVSSDAVAIYSVPFKLGDDSE